jgi:urease accessory protein
VVLTLQKNGVGSGHASLEVSLVSSQSTVTSAFATSPMKLLTPRSRGRSVWAFTSSFGGGLVAGDQTRLDLVLRSETKCFVGTQASTKIYRNPHSRPCGHVTEARLEPGALLVFAPDPIQTFSESSYAQAQTFHLAPDAGLAFVDWFSAGRAARGERWAFTRFASRSEVSFDDHRVFLDSLCLDPSDGDFDCPCRAGRFNCVAVLALLGAPLREVAARVVESVSVRPVERRSPTICSASPHAHGAVLRVAGEKVEAVARELHRHLALLAPLLGDDPWKRKW